MTTNMINGTGGSANLKIVSGAQTGVDRAALDAALVLGVPAGGWVPQGRMAEDGIIPSHYPIQELAGAGYRERTRQNVIDSDATLIIYFDELFGGTKATFRDCQIYKKPYCLIDAAEVDVQHAAQKLADFIQRHNISVLNVAGPRASGEARAYEYTKQVLLQLFSILPNSENE